MADPPLTEPTFEALQSAIKPALLATTRTASALVAEDIPFQRSLNSEFARDLDKQNARLLSLAERLLASAMAGAENVSSGSTTSRSATIAVPALSSIRLRDSDALERNWDKVVDVVDSLLERTDGVLDEVRGVVKTGVAKMGGSETEKVMTPRLSKGIPKAANIIKPQRTFEYPPNNYATGAWKPLLTSKPHAKIPLEASFQTEAGPEGTPKYQHPYRTEIEEYRYPPSMYIEREPAMYKPWETTTATFVDTEEAVAEMLEELKKAKEIAIDLEHHDQRTYLGIVCLMQISTRDRDWVVDTLKPWRRKLECLNEVFANPNIIKVLHGSSSDVIWLQRDLGLYINGLFDTEIACTALRYPKRSLAYLLEKFVNFQAQKQYQLADWRVRPLPAEMFDYARSDTHFLLYVYDCMHNELVQNTKVDDEEGDLIDRVLRGSKEYQLRRYENPIYDSETGLGAAGWYKQLFRTPALLSKTQFSVFKAIHQWRDSVARREDENIMYIMNNHTLTSLARAMPLTKEDLFNAGDIKPFAKQFANELVRVIAAGKAAGVDGPEMREALARSDELADERMAYTHQAKQASIAAIMAKAKSDFATQAATSETITSPKRPTLVDIGAVKSASSTFWGSTLGNSTQQRHLSSNVALSLPMPNLAAEAFTPEADVTSAQAPETLAPATPVPSDAPTQSEVKHEKVDGTFTLRGMTKTSKKRKAAAPTAEDVQDDLESSLMDIDDGPKDSIKKQKKSTQSAENINGKNMETKAERRAKRKQERAEQEEHAASVGHAAARNDFIAAALGASAPGAPPGTESTQKTKNKEKHSGEKNIAAYTGNELITAQDAQVIEAQPDVQYDGEEKPFDYAAAPDMLNPGGAATNGRKRNKEKKKGKGMMGFDPYKKAMDAPKGLPKAQREKVGLAGTFK